jgi:methylphosphotriester-DNA--protein-cysteine methyltransferase
MGPRNFIRRFKAATGRVPGAYLQTLRVSATKEMLEYGTVDPGGLHENRVRGHRVFPELVQAS